MFFEEESVILEEIATKYFKFWNDRDLFGLRSLLANNAVLKDWEVDVSGVDNVVFTNEKIFDAFPSIEAKIKRLGYGNNVIFAEITVVLNSEEYINVVDVISVQDGLITAIHAFKN